MKAVKGKAGLAVATGQVAAAAPRFAAGVAVGSTGVLCAQQAQGLGGEAREGVAGGGANDVGNGGKQGAGK